ncbi:hypothetical protein GYMLUDRAFT_176445 [Collybiopsis luxurians FD-317 M1]|uniref:Carrier domain-containing protein n=1 Tax=Collybiopsis luxurians FD-317 M1 TaxID=944289 RepID=A0A0D0AWG0_9AGAR|nr:hypothetical protein GYMLUDRAFT_176445 [Collybiopsis luxurians FD-317 M1]
MRLQAADTKYLISDTHNAGRYPLQHTIVLTESDVLIESAAKGLREVPLPLLAKFPLPLAQDHRSHIFFTSGTTGIPKAVQILSQGITRLCGPWKAPTMVGSQIVAHINNVGFDASILDTWVALLDGCTIAVLDRELLLSPDRFLATLERMCVTAMFMTTSLFNVVSRANTHAFSSFDKVIFGGESPSNSAVKAVIQSAPPRHLIHAYGPTEFSVLAITHEVTLSDVLKGYLPLGKQLNHTEVYLINDSLQQIDGEGSGELALGGLGLARGYLNDTARTSQSFITVPDKRRPGAMMTLYRTGDLIQRHANGDLVWRARLNNEVKLRGYRVNLDVIEDTLIATGLLVAAAVVKLSSPDNLSASLVAGIVFKDQFVTDRQLLLQKARQSLPHYMVPQIVVLRALPLNRNGKVDRKELEKFFLEGKRASTLQDVINKIPRLSMQKSTEHVLKVIWMHMLDVFEDQSIGSDTDFFALGATSLHVASLTVLAREIFGVPLSAEAVYEHPTLKQLSNHVDRVLRGESKHDIDRCKQQWKLDAALAQNLILPDGSCPDWTSRNEGKIFLTGATGFVAAFLLQKLLIFPGVQSIKCLVRAKTPILDNLAKYRIEDLTDTQLSKIDALVGDLADPTLGLGQGSFEELGHWTSIIFHLGAQVNYNQPYNAHRPANVLGTLHILQLVATGRPKAFHYISSIAAFGPTSLLKQKEISEEEPLAPYIDSIVYETGYGQSQWVADEMVQSLIGKGFPIAIHRLGFVLCHSETGIGNQDDFMSRLVVDCINLGVYPLLPDQRKELLPVDYAASSILAISLSDRNLGRVFHIAPDNALTSSMDMIDLFQEIERIIDIHLVGVPYDEWLSRLERFGNTAILRMAPLMPVLTEKVYHDKSRWEVHEFMSKFLTDNTREALIAAGLEEVVHRSAVDRNILARYLSFLRLE